MDLLIVADPITLLFSLLPFGFPESVGALLSLVFVFLSGFPLLMDWRRRSRPFEESFESRTGGAKEGGGGGPGGGGGTTGMLIFILCSYWFGDTNIDISSLRGKLISDTSFKTAQIVT